MSSHGALRWMLPVAAIAGLMLAGAGDAIAQASPDNRLDRIVDLYRLNAGKWESVLRNYALRLFWLLATIEFIWAAARLVLRGADIQEWTAEVVNQIMFIGFFLALLLNSSAWSRAIVNSFLTAGGNASVAAGGSSAVSPSNIFDVGLMVASKVMEQASFWSPGDSLGLMISALVVIVCFALIAAFMIVALVEAYIVISGGVLLMGFGGSRWTKDYAVKLIVYAVSVGAKLFVLQLLVGLGEAMVRGWVDDFQNDNAEIFMMVGSSIVMLALVKLIPGIVQGLINGASVASDGGLAGTVKGMAQMAAGAAAAAVKGGAGAGYAMSGAHRLASEQLKSPDLNGSGGAGSGQAGRFAEMTGAAANLWSAAKEDLGARLGGRAHHGTMAGRMGHSMHSEARGMELGRTRPMSVGGAGGAAGQGSGKTSTPTESGAVPMNILRPAAEGDPGGASSARTMAAAATRQGETRAPDLENEGRRASELGKALAGEKLEQPAMHERMIRLPEMTGGTAESSPNPAAAGAGARPVEVPAKSAEQSAGASARSSGASARIHAGAEKGSGLQWPSTLREARAREIANLGREDAGQREREEAPLPRTERIPDDRGPDSIENGKAAGPEGT